MSAYTPGPWAWQEMGSWCLVGQYGMRPIVLSARAARRPQEGGPPAAGVLMLRDSGPDRLIQFNPEHPDARLIATSPRMAELLLSAWQHVTHGGPKRGDVEDVLREAGLLPPEALGRS